MQLSIISPVYNEKKNIKFFYSKLATVVRKLGLSTEIIFVDDGSVDGSLSELKRVARLDKHVKVIVFSRNFGQTAAIQAGIMAAKGKIIVLIDSDLQNDPADIAFLVEKIDKGFDVVSGWRKNRKDPLLSKVIPSLLANKLLAFMFGLRIHDFGCTLKAYKSKFIKDINLYGEMHRIIPAYAAARGAKITEVVVKHYPRRYGKSKYNLTRTFKVLFDLLTVKFLVEFSTKPLYLFGTVGLLNMFLGALIFVFVAVRVVFFHGGWVSPLLLLSGLLAIVSFQFVLIGLLAEILVRIYFQAEGKPPYSISLKINFS